MYVPFLIAMSSAVLGSYMSLSQDTSDPNSGFDMLTSGMVTSSSGSKEASAGKSGGSKMQKLQLLIAEAEKKKARLDALREQGEKGKEQLNENHWKDVLKEAAGGAVLHDTKKLKKAMKRIEKGKEKSGREWKARTELLESTKAKRIEKREGNILKRKRGTDYIEPTAEEKVAAESSQPGGSSAAKGKPISGGLTAAGAGPAKQMFDNSKVKKQKLGQQNKSRAGFEGKKSDFLNNKKK